MGNALEGTSVKVDIVVIGAGPAGLGAAYRFHRQGFENWLLLDAQQLPGAEAGSVKTAEGFRFDCGFKTLSTRFEYFDKFLKTIYNEETGKTLKQLERDNYVFIRDRMVRYPIQNNLGFLPPAERETCLVDFLKTKLASLGHENRAAPLNLDDYLVFEWGESLCNIFFRPYVFKMWAYPPGKLSFDWVKSKIPPATFGDDFDRVLSGEQKDPGELVSGRTWNKMLDSYGQHFDYCLCTPSCCF